MNNNNNMHTPSINHKFIWDAEPTIPLFASISGFNTLDTIDTKCSDSKHGICLYSCFNYTGSALRDNNDDKRLYVYYGGERFLDEINSNVVIGFLPNNIYLDHTIYHTNATTNDNDQGDIWDNASANYNDNDLNIIHIANINDNEIKHYTGLDKATASTPFLIMVIDIDNKPYTNIPSDIIEYNPLNRSKIVLQLREQERNQLEYWLRIGILSRDILSDWRYLSRNIIDIYGNLNAEWKNEGNRIRELGLYNAKPRFCCFIVSNPNCKQRNLFFELLSKNTKTNASTDNIQNSNKIDSMGRYLRNVQPDFIVPDRMDQDAYFNLIRQYRFMITFENHALPHYQTEKIFNSYMAGTVPIYWGDPFIQRVYNKNTFINVAAHDSIADQYKAYTSAIETINSLENNQNKYLSMFNLIPVLNAKLEDRRVCDNLAILANLGFASNCIN